MTSIFLATNFSSMALSSFISSFIGEMTDKSSLLQEVAEVHLASRCVPISSPLLRPSRLKTLGNGLRASFVISFSRNLAIVSGLVVQLDAVIF